LQPNPEISRLGHSLNHLKNTQQQIQEFLRGTPADRELTDAFEENKHVISSQEERIAMLRVVLQQKAGPPATNGHYQPHPASANKSAAHLAEEENGVFL